MFTTLLVGLFPLARGLQLIFMFKGNDGLKVIWPENLRKLPSQEASAKISILHAGLFRCFV